MLQVWGEKETNSGYEMGFLQYGNVRDKELR